MENASTNVWDPMVLFKHLTLRNILNGREDFSNAELRATVAALTIEQWDDAVFFFMHETGVLVGLPDGQGIQAVANVCALLDYLPTINNHFLKKCYILGDSSQGICSDKTEASKRTIKQKVG